MAHIGMDYQREYLLGLEHLRMLIHDTETEVDNVKHEFYQSASCDEEQFENYLKSINDRMLYCNTKLRKSDVELIVVDSEIKLVSLLNQVRDLDDDVDPDVISELTEFWENLKNTIESLRSIINKFHTNTLTKLKNSCVGVSNGGTVALTQAYAQDISQYQTEIEATIVKSGSLLNSSENKIDQDLFTNSNFSERVLVACDHKAFPILRLVPDVTEKVAEICRLSRQWIDRDETYVHDLTNSIRESRTINRKKKADLREQREKCTALEHTTNDAYELYRANQKRVQQLESEMGILEQQVIQYMRLKEFKADEKRQKESMAGFLEISISQTKKNQTMQLKRSRLLRQLRELEESLREIHQDLSAIQREVEQKSEMKPQLQEEAEESQRAYVELRSDLDHFSQNLEQLQQEVNDLSEYVTQLEIVQNLKTSPENVDDFYDRPASVKLAPSLREKILRKRKLRSLSQKGSISSRF